MNRKEQDKCVAEKFKILPEEVAILRRYREFPSDRFRRAVLMESLRIEAVYKAAEAIARNPLGPYYPHGCRDRGARKLQHSTRTTDI